MSEPPRILTRERVIEWIAVGDIETPAVPVPEREPALVLATENGYTLLAGMAQFEATEYVHGMIEAEVLPKGTSPAAIRAIVNERHAPPKSNPIDEADATVAIVEATMLENSLDEHRAVRAVAERLGVKRAEIRTRMHVAATPPEVRAAVRAGSVARSVAARFAQLDEDQTRVALGLLGKQGTISEADLRVVRGKDPQPSKLRAPIDPDPGPMSDEDRFALELERAAAAIERAANLNLEAIETLTPAVMNRIDEARQKITRAHAARIGRALFQITPPTAEQIAEPCARGLHPMTPENTQTINHKNGRVERRCKACVRERRAARKAEGAA